MSLLVLAGWFVVHCDQQYDVRFQLRYSARPWADRIAKRSRISGARGYLWHAHWYIGQRYLDARRFWVDSLSQGLKDLLVFVCAPMSVAASISFPAVADPDEIADAIESCFDGIVASRGHGEIPSLDLSDGYDEWVEINKRLDPRVKVNSPWPIIDDTTTPVSMFGAERDT